MLKALVHDEKKVTDTLVDMRYQASIMPGVKEALGRFAAGGQVPHERKMFTNFDMRESLPKITKQIPTICFWGKNDSFVPLHVGQKLETLLPDIKFYFVDGAGHQVQTDQAEFVATTLKAFF